MMRTNQNQVLWPHILTSQYKIPSLTISSHNRKTKAIELVGASAREVPGPPHTPFFGAVLGPTISMSYTHHPHQHHHMPPAQQSETPPTPLPPTSSSLYKQRSWSPDIYREEAWLKRKGNSKNRRSRSVTDEDLDELKACIELGFGFDSPEVDQRLSDTLPALGLYHAVNKQYIDTLSKSSTRTSFSSTASECDTPSPLGSPHTIFGPGDNPQTVKTRLRHWAQVVGCSVKQFSG